MFKVFGFSLSRGGPARTAASRAARARASGGRCVAEPLEPRALFSATAGFAETLVASGLNSPSSMTVAPDGRLFYSEQAGKIRVVKGGKVLPAPFATVPAIFLAERGLLGIAFDPRFEQNGYVYVYYTVHTPNPHNVIARLTADPANPDVAAAGSEVRLLELPELKTVHHVGGSMHFGPDGKLYVAVGDNGTGTNAQSLATPFGKMLRINPDGSIPADNPFYDRTAGVNQAIWATGLRNPFSFDFQPGTGRMFINDVGLNTWEEVNEGVKGANYGWPGIEGPRADQAAPPAPADYHDPVYAYEHGAVEADGCSIVGSAFYEAPAGAANPFPAAYQGQYLFADLCRQDVQVLDPATGRVTGTFATGLNRPVDLDVGPDGSVYALARGQSGGSDGTIVKFTFNGQLAQAPSILDQPDAQVVTAGEEAATFRVAAEGEAPLAYQWQRDGADIPGATSDTYTLPSVSAAADNGAAFRVVVSNAAGRATSDAAALTVTTNRPPAPRIDLPADGATYRAGEAVTFAGAATDPEDGDLPPAAFTWEVVFHHETHTHPFLPPFGGQAGGTFTVPAGGESSADTWYRIHLTATDSAGRARTVTRDIRPRTAAITLDTSIPGLSVTLDGQPVTGPASVPGVSGFVRSLAAPAAQELNGITYDFVSWSDGGAAAHDIRTPDAATTYTAAYQPRVGTGPPVADLAAAVAASVAPGGPSAFTAGATASAAVRLVNAGTAAVTGPVKVRAYLSADATLDDADTPVAELTKSVNLRPGQAALVKRDFKVPAALGGGSYYLIARADTGGRIEEATTTNNVAAAAAPVAVTPPSVNLIVVLPPGTPKTLRAGGTGKVRVTVTNAGTATAAGPATVSLAAVPSGAAPGAPGAAGVPLATSAKRVKVKPGRGVTFTLKFRRPDALGPGTYFFRAAVDAASPLVESNEGDNAVTGTEPLVAP